MNNIHFDQLNQLLARSGFELKSFEPVQSLWKGYGHIIRVHLKNHALESAILKLIEWPAATEAELAHHRKVRSYQVEAAWYRHASSLCTPDCRVPRAYAQGDNCESQWLLLEDLDRAGYPERKRRLNSKDIRSVLSWLAHFHARFLNYAASELWPQGSYWYLDTRPDEWATLPDGLLKQSAHLIDHRLKACRYQTLLHGDAKPANFCFGAQGVAALDFQYVGRGCAMKDLVYFLSACVPESDCFEKIPAYLDLYFLLFRRALNDAAQASIIEQEWRILFPWAWCDWYRFERGWYGGFVSEAPYSESLLRQISGK